MSVNERVGEHRRRMRERGLRPVQFWLPDVRTPEFAELARRESLAVAAADRSSDDMDFVEAITAPWDEE